LVILFVLTPRMKRAWRSGGSEHGREVYRHGATPRHRTRAPGSCMPRGDINIFGCMPYNHNVYHRFALLPPCVYLERCWLHLFACSRVYWRQHCARSFGAAMRSKRASTAAGSRMLLNVAVPFLVLTTLALAARARFVTCFAVLADTHCVAHRATSSSAHALSCLDMRGSGALAAVTYPLHNSRCVCIP